MAEPKQISMFVRKPDALWRNSLSSPITPPRIAASNSRAEIDPSTCDPMNSTPCSTACTMNSSQKFIIG